ncbi:MAG: hypothetical protein HGA87_01525 [Desulfobulbaceae bacterium]|nr:hypothetical protein [Desulfobulbaceae bacterium]
MIDGGKKDQRKVGANMGNRGLGRKKGVPNKTTKALKDMILGALDGAGGQEYLKTQAKENPGSFMTLIGKVLPSTLQVTGEGGGPVQHNFNFTVITAKDADND